MAEKVKALLPSIDLVRMVSSGTEATMSAIRLARGYTGRERSLNLKAAIMGILIHYSLKPAQAY